MEEPTRSATPADAHAAARALVAACEGLVFRALERAGNRLRVTAAKPPRCPSYETHLYVKANGTAARMLEDAWSCAPQVLDGIADPEKIIPVLDSYCQSLLSEQSPHKRERLVELAAPGRPGARHDPVLHRRVRGQPAQGPGRRDRPPSPHWSSLAENPQRLHPPGTHRRHVSIYTETYRTEGGDRHPAARQVPARGPHHPAPLQPGHRPGTLATLLAVTATNAATVQAAGDDTEPLLVGVGHHARRQGAAHPPRRRRTTTPPG